jgi:hypothetical protein
MSRRIGVVPPFAAVPADATPRQRGRIVRAFLAAHPGLATVAVRSSALPEDGAGASYAGAFDTYLNVPARARDIGRKVRRIQTAGQRKLKDVFNHAAQKSVGVVIQQMVENPDVAGVCLTQGYGADDRACLMINFRHGLGDALVGGADSGETLRVLRDMPLSAETVRRYPFLPGLLDSIARVEAHFGSRPLDMEFAVKDGTVYLLQARPFVTPVAADAEVRLAAAMEARELQREINAIPENDLLCDMTDINPRELLGPYPAAVNVALFRQMFADRIVEEARGAMGYAPLGKGLLREIGGKPYVSLRASAYSLRPAGIPDAVYDRMVDIYRERIAQDPALQDSAEFNVFITSARQLPAFFAAHGKRFSMEERGAITAAFERLDLDRSGTIEYAELEAIIREMTGTTPDEEVVKRLMSEVLVRGRVECRRAGMP